MVRRTFTETIDINTEPDGPTLIGLHTPIGGDVYRFLYPFFMAYKKFKYHGMNVTIVNSARLPYDPEQIGKIAGTNYVDPRDSLNPILFKGCHGDSLGNVLNSMYGGLTEDVLKSESVDVELMKQTLENFYYTALGDDAWRKSPIQKTLRIRGLHPLVYNLAYNHQILPTNDMGPVDYVENSTYADATGLESSTRQAGFPASSVGGTARSPAITPSRLFNVNDSAESDTAYRVLGSMFTNKCMRLGWLDTLQLVGSKDQSWEFKKEQVTLLPKIFMGLLMLPRANLTRNYLRVIIEHKFSFSGYRTITTGGAFPGFDGNNDHWGYRDLMTGLTSSDEGSKAVPVERSDPVDYDAIEEDDDE